MRLLSENALRRAEVCSLDVRDFSLTDRRLIVRGKGHGTPRSRSPSSQGTADAIAAYLVAAGHAADVTAPLFRNVHRVPRWSGERLTEDGLHDVVGTYGRAVGVENLTPHKLRHSAITAALDAGLSIRKVQKLCRTAKLETLQRYDDARQDFQGEATDLAALLEVLTMTEEEIAATRHTWRPREEFPGSHRAGRATSRQTCCLNPKRCRPSTSWRRRKDAPVTI